MWLTLGDQSMRQSQVAGIMWMLSNGVGGGVGGGGGGGGGL